ncbi:AbrB family transcriptional regulator [Ilumatobacter sp.]|uniref:AbrB family transcriptional regulator n=1 Tax=Ilumatobacter sp. TaxID=1967498 RepID=UPI003B52344C
MPTIVTVVAALVGAFALDRLDVPAGSLLGAVAGVAAVNLLTGIDAVELPAAGRFAAFAALGWAIGEGVTGETVRQLGSSVDVIAITVVVLVVVGALTAWAMTAAGLTDASTAYLATSPGALSQMAALSADTGADSLLVTTTHTVRVIVVVLVSPLVAAWLTAGTAGTGAA